MQQLEQRNKKIIQIEGSFYSSYSLAIVNRLLAKSLKQKDLYEIRIYSNNTIGDYIPNDKELSEDKDLKEMFTKDRGEPDIAIMNAYPHTDFVNMTGKINFGYFFWEESFIPQSTVDIFNSKLDGLIVSSSFVKEVALRSGITIPIEIIHCGVENLSLVEKTLKLPTIKNYKFLHNSSCFPRKGVDVLLKAYFEEFTKNDDVTLVIKTFPNPHNTVNQQLMELRKKYIDYPEVIVIEEDYSWEKMSSLYKTIDAVVLPTRCEGFGLPQAEAMLAKRPLITTGYSSHTDFCSPNNSFLIDYKLAQSSSHLNTGQSVWANPSIKDLRKKLRYIYINSTSDKVKEKVEKAYIEIKNNYNWSSVADNFIDYIKYFDKIKNLKKKNIAVMTTWNTKCGIAKYSQDFYRDSFPYFKNHGIFSTIETPVLKDTKHVNRFWLQQYKVDIAKFIESLKIEHTDILHIQHQPAFYDNSMLAELIDSAKKLNIKVVITLHSLEEFKRVRKLSPEMLNCFNKCDIIYTFREDESDFLKSLKLKNIKTISIGNNIYKDEDRYLLRKSMQLKSNHIIASHGFLLPHKNFDKVIQAVKILKQDFPDIIYLMITSIHGSNSSALNYLNACKTLINNLSLQDNVLLIEDFLTVDEIESLLHTADLSILPYEETPDSSSAAIRHALGSKRPVIVSQANIFNDVRGCTIKLKDLSVETITAFIKDLLNQKSLQEDLVSKANEFMYERSWEKLSKNYLLDIEEVINKN